MVVIVVVVVVVAVVISIEQVLPSFLDLAWMVPYRT